MRIQAEKVVLEGAIDTSMAVTVRQNESLHIKTFQNWI